MGAFLVPIIEILYYVLNIYMWLIIISAVLSWLIAFGIVNTYNRTVATVGDFLYRITEPVLRPIRQFLPHLGGIDVSPIVAILIIWLLQAWLIALIPYVYRL
ncbi:MAG TPA: YggT family protein [Stellaceae bacterium]